MMENTAQTVHRDGERGAILLFTIVLLSLVAGAAASYAVATRGQLAAEDESSQGLRAEFGAESAFEHARRQIAIDPDWESTVSFDLNGLAFEVQRHDTPDPLNQTVAELTLTGTSREAEYRLAAELLVDPGDPMRNQTLACLGRSLNIHNMVLYGGILIADDLGVVYDWNPLANGGAGGWELGGPASLGRFKFTSTDLYGNLYKYTNKNYIAGADEYIVTTPVYMPAWDMDVYDGEGPDRIVLHSPGVVSSLETDLIVVIHLEPGESVILEDVQIRGGLVVFMPDDYPIRSAEPRNVLEFKQWNEIGGGSSGVDPHLGILAPGAELRGKSGQGIQIVGACLLNMVDTNVHVDLTGQLIVINDIKNLNNATLRRDHRVTENPPPGLTYEGPPSSSSVLSLKESYVEPEGQP